MGNDECRDLVEGFKRHADKIGIDYMDCCTTHGYVFTLGDAISMAAAMASAGYDLQTNNCRHFAKSIYMSLRDEMVVLAEDDEQKRLRKIAKRMEYNGSSVGSVLSASYVAYETRWILSVALESSTTGGTMSAILATMATSPDMWLSICNMVTEFRKLPALRC